MSDASSFEATPLLPFERNADGGALIIPLDQLAHKAREFAEHSRATATLRAYKSDFRHFSNWCEQHHLLSLPTTPHTLSIYLAELALSMRPSTIGRRLAAISVYHTTAGFESPTRDGIVRAVLSGLRRQLGTSVKPKRAIVIDDLKRIVMALADDCASQRDRALLLVGWSGALRRSELVALDVADIGFVSEGLMLSLKRSKTNQYGRSEEIAVPYGSDPRTCPVRALATWLERAKIIEGPIFRPIGKGERIGSTRLNDKSVALIVKRRAGAVGYDAPNVAGHSLRRGFATTAAHARKTQSSIKRQGRWKSDAVLAGYIEQRTRWDDNANYGLGL